MEILACGACRSNLHMIEGDWLALGVPAFNRLVGSVMARA